MAVAYIWHSHCFFLSCSILAYILVALSSHSFWMQCSCRSCQLVALARQALIKLKRRRLSALPARSSQLNLICKTFLK